MLAEIASGVVAQRKSGGPLKGAATLVKPVLVYLV
jgi:hypothetical protein